MGEAAKDSKRPVIALTGASGYIGSSLLKRLEGKAKIVALSRNGDQREDSAAVSWRSCDLFSLQSAEEGLRGADYAVYLVHSMMPSARLTQASFEDMDLILADNFARAAKKNGIKQIVYLSGIIPENTENLSRHLKSRLEVEKVLGSYGVPVTTLRAGLIVGPQGSSFPILSRLASRLPVMLLPKWTRTNTQPIALSDVLTALCGCIGREDLYTRAIDAGGPDVMTYKEMIVQTAEVMGKTPYTADVPFLSVTLSRLWISLIAQAPKETAYPLIESLIHPMTADKEKMAAGISYGRQTFKEAAARALEEEKGAEKKKNSGHSRKTSSFTGVRSVQRILIPEGQTADWAAAYYMQWLGSFAKPLLSSRTDAERKASVFLPFLKKPLLEMSYVKERSTSDRALYKISGGMFVSRQEGPAGRIEFRQVPGTQECIIAIHEYRPSLPWIIYKTTQAKIHLAVMNLFKKHLLKLMKKGHPYEQGQQVRKMADEH
ncbi:NAD(P)H-binding protein [Metabacillus sp. GX 13764]|uniref:NAD(P)H-binding protein n=1 Tax=Metabacillus kandeliae TaxID=2900151 RepID=UPI001E596877|nr:NAD(P)H-binding protein [Metabacillus kandeliae]MCD7034732.1 NAD(P)H-binding protein [Metabacillus kandeliae]